MKKELENYGLYLIRIDEKTHNLLKN